jgi:hypothetical protein
MASESRVVGIRFAVSPVLWALLLAASAGAWGQSKGPSIFTCTDASGKRHTSDHIVKECADREQRELNADGSLRRVVPPTMTADERAEAEAKEREVQAERVARSDAIRRDRNLMIRFPNEGAHRKAREDALDDIRNAIRISEARVKLLLQERKHLMDETEFYVGKPLPPNLKAAIDANDAALAAQRALIQNQEAEVVRINDLYDVELARLRKLWAGAPAGSLGPASAPPPTPAASGKTASGKTASASPASKAR